MALVASGDATLSKSNRAQLPLPTTDTAPSSTARDVAAAAWRHGGVASMLWDRYVANLGSDFASVPGYYLLAGVPLGNRAFTDRFLDS